MITLPIMVLTQITVRPKIILWIDLPRFSNVSTDSRIALTGRRGHRRPPCMCWCRSRSRCRRDQGSRGRDTKDQGSTVRRTPRASCPESRSQFRSQFHSTQVARAASPHLQSPRHTHTQPRSHSLSLSWRCFRGVIGS
jgi:hypothetical protein